MRNAVQACAVDRGRRKEIDMCAVYITKYNRHAGPHISSRIRACSVLRCSEASPICPQSSTEQAPIPHARRWVLASKVLVDCVIPHLLVCLLSTVNTFLQAGQTLRDFAALYSASRGLCHVAQVSRAKPGQAATGSEISRRTPRPPEHWP